MHVSTAWLKRYLPLTQTTDEVTRALTLIGFEVEGVTRSGLAPLAQVVVGEVLASAQHPNADRLSVCEVRVAEDGPPRTIVCGAKNYRVGDRVPVALPGAVLPGDFTIKESKLRGVLSQGMMCSARELGLGEDHGGLLILAERPALGTPIHEVFPEDVVYDLEITPNRPDCLSHFGIARELAAYFRLPLSYPEVRSAPEDPFHDRPLPLLDAVQSEVPENCPHYRAYSLRGVKVGPSPEWLRRLLTSVGLRPINNVVDATNFVLHELGHPLHAFDARKLQGARIVVRAAAEGEKFTTLDGKERVLDARMTVIADATRAVAVAGVMGGLYSEVDDTTTDVVLEAAYFNAVNIRQTARRLGLSTDASYRYERGVDPRGADYAALRCLDLIRETAGGELAGPAQVAGEPPRIEREITLRHAFVESTLGFPVPAAEIERVLESLQLDAVSDPNGDGLPAWRVTVPSFRLDLERPIDLVEEILRIHGTEKIPAIPVRSHGLLAEDDGLAVFTRRAVSGLVARGFHECAHYTLRSAEELTRWFPPEEASAFALANPLASDQSHLRRSLLPGLLDALQLNLNRRNDPRRLCESGRVFQLSQGQVHEWVSVAFVLPQKPQEKSWLERPAPDFHLAASLVREILALTPAGAPPAPAALTGEALWQDGHSALLGGWEQGWLAHFGLLHLGLSRAWQIDGPVVAGEFLCDPDFLRRGGARPVFRHFSLFPDVTKDLALIVEDGVSAATVQAHLEAAARAACPADFAVESVRPFDVYRGEGLPLGCKSLAFTLRFRSPTRTLTDDEVNRAFEAAQTALQTAHPYRVRK